MPLLEAAIGAALLAAAVAYAGRSERGPLRNALNALLMVAVVAPPALLAARLRDACASLESPPPAANDVWELGLLWLRRIAAAEVPSPENSCQLYLRHPLLCVNLIYLVVVDVGFYVVYLLQGSTWLIDPHWQIIPASVAAFWFSHPDSADAAAEGHGRSPRALLALALISTWAIRLLHNYFRREGWAFGHQEDWRYADMRREHGVAWVFTQFFAVSVAQHGMIVGLTLPLQPAMAADAAPLNALDAVAVAVCVSGIAIGFVADNQLRAYMTDPDKPIILETGLWRYSRHPNHFGEQLWWVGLLLLGVAAKSEWWPICFGVLFNHSLDTFATLPLIEERMLRRPKRAAAFRTYQVRTSLLVPMPRRERAKAQ